MNATGMQGRLGEGDSSSCALEVPSILVPYQSRKRHSFAMATDKYENCRWGCELKSVHQADPVRFPDTNSAKSKPEARQMKED
jgi:hypothetical protein